jgi:hypothetical protein
MLVGQPREKSGSRASWRSAQRRLFAKRSGSGGIGGFVVTRFRRELAADQHPADFAGAGADFVELCVAP